MIQQKRSLMFCALPGIVWTDSSTPTSARLLRMRPLQNLVDREVIALLPLSQYFLFMQQFAN
jgi:hypothetical protein